MNRVFRFTGSLQFRPGSAIGPVSPWRQRPTRYRNSTGRPPPLNEAAAAAPGGILQPTFGRTSRPIMTSAGNRVKQPQPGSGQGKLFDLARSWQPGEQPQPGSCQGIPVDSPLSGLTVVSRKNRHPAGERKLEMQMSCSNQTGYTGGSRSENAAGETGNFVPCDSAACRFCRSSRRSCGGSPCPISRLSVKHFTPRKNDPEQAIPQKMSACMFDRDPRNRISLMPGRAVRPKCGGDAVADRPVRAVAAQQHSVTYEP